MVKKRTHSDAKLFNYLSGAVDEKATRSIEAHLSVCDDCASVAGLVRQLKESASPLNCEDQSQISTLESQEHPDISELASFFYGKTRRAVSSAIAGHLALCKSCGEAIAQYAHAEKAAAEYKPVDVAGGEVPAKAWEMIRDWEDSNFAKLKPATEVLSQELLMRLARILKERDREPGGLGQEISRSQDVQQTEEAERERVPVLVVSRSGEVRSVELFEREVDSTGASVLRHAGGSARFDNKPLHALFDFGERDPFVVSNLIRRDTIRLEQTRPEKESRRAAYFIIEESRD